MLNCTINGHPMQVKEGATLMEAFHQLNKKIAYYCWHPGLSVAGVCRLCMVEIKGQPKLQIACNTPITEGMVATNQSEQVKEAVQWGLEFHLINHPLDCPICDQAGECGLQEHYMEYGKYRPHMAENKVKKRKVVDLGPRVVLDTERCILCTRCVRFTDEVSKTHELGIFQRGDLSEIGTFENKPLDNNYALNTVDICPVGALTAKDFRFQQRVWYLKKAESLCTGCSTGCNTWVYFNKEGLFRFRPRYNKDVNGYWMCDVGREIYKFINRDSRLLLAREHSFFPPQGKEKETKSLKVTAKAKKSIPSATSIAPIIQAQASWKELSAGEAMKKLNPFIEEWVKKEGAESMALVLTPQYTQEELESFTDTFISHLKGKPRCIFHWQNTPRDFKKTSDFDGLLYRGDANPNTFGLKLLMKEKNLQGTWKELEQRLEKGSVKLLLVLAPENQGAYTDLSQKLLCFQKATHLVWFSSVRTPLLDGTSQFCLQVPLKSYIEKSGTFMNYKGLKQKIHKVVSIVSQSLSLEECAQLLRGEELLPQIGGIPREVDSSKKFSEKESLSLWSAYGKGRKDQVRMEKSKKNERLFERDEVE